MHRQLLLLISVFVSMNAMLDLPQEVRKLIFLHLIESARELSELKLICCGARVNKKIYNDYQADIIKNKIKKVKKKLIKQAKYFQDSLRSIRPRFQCTPQPEKITFFLDRLNLNDPQWNSLSGIKIDTAKLLKERIELLKKLKNKSLFNSEDI